MLQNKIIRQIKEMRPWFHNLHLVNGIQTAPDHVLGDFPSFKWVEIAPFIPDDLNGWTVMDIGCNAGFYSFELAKRGASVTGIDIDSHYLKQADWAANLMNLKDKVKFEEKQIYELSKIKTKFDIIWYMGVFYHLRYPLLSLDIISRITGKMMVFQTMTMPDKEDYEARSDVDLFKREILSEPGWPKLSFVENCIAGDPTNWWVPNHSAVMSILKTCGFKVINRPSHEVYICEPDGNTMKSGSINDYQYRAATGIL